MEAIEDLRRFLEEKFENHQQLNDAYLATKRRHCEFLASVRSKVVMRIQRAELLKNNRST